MLTKLILVLAVACSTSVADITGTKPATGSCLCITETRVNVRSSPCGPVIGTENSGRCYKYKGVKQSCTLSGTRYEFFQFNYGGKNGWTAGTLLRIGPASSCGQSGTQPPAVVSGSYTCDIAHQGKRVHESPNPTPYDCKHSTGNTCKGGQCVAYVTCNCRRNGKWLAATKYWRPGTKVFGNDGKCNRSIPRNTAIATFDSNGKYNYDGHAAVFVECLNDSTVRVYDQYCSRAVGYATYSYSHRFSKKYAVILNSDVGSDRTNYKCRIEPSGSNTCSA